MSTTWLERLEKLLGGWRDRGAGNTWVVAVSGGSDSVALLHALHQLGPSLGLTLSVAHLNHGVRGDAAQADATFVADLSQQLGLSCDVGRWRPSRSAHFEVDARRARYAWLVEMAQARGASAVVVGHTQDDQAETILHRIIRGTGLQGLKGIPPRRRLNERVVLLRPLLAVSRQELRAFLGSIGQPFREDATNTDRAHTRARIRHDLLPKIAAEYNPRAAEALVRLGELAASSLQAHQRQLAKIESRAILSVSADAVALARGPLKRCPEFLRIEVIRRAWRRAGWPEVGMTALRWRRLALMVDAPQPRAAVGQGIEASSGPELLELRRSRQVLNHAPQPQRTEPRELELPGKVDWEGGSIAATFAPEEPRDESIDLDRLALPLFVRVPSPGDRFEPLGMHGQSTPLNDFLRNRRIPRDARAGIPLLCDQLGIVWVVGHRIAERVRVTETTQQRLGLRWDPSKALENGPTSV